MLLHTKQLQQKQERKTVGRNIGCCGTAKSQPAETTQPALVEAMRVNELSAERDSKVEVEE